MTAARDRDNSEVVGLFCNLRAPVGLPTDALGLLLGVGGGALRWVLRWGMYARSEGVRTGPDGMYTAFEGMYAIPSFMPSRQASDLRRRRRAPRIKLATAYIPFGWVYTPSPSEALRARPGCTSAHESGDFGVLG